MTEITSKPDHGTRLTEEQRATTRFQEFLDDLEEQLNSNLLGDAVIFQEYTVATLPSASENDNGVIIVSDEAGGRTLATSDATNWMRVSDGAVVS